MGRQIKSLFGSSEPKAAAPVIAKPAAPEPTKNPEVTAPELSDAEQAKRRGIFASGLVGANRRSLLAQSGVSETLG